jgi:tripartite ATP-independent transporter DctM subunit
MSGIQAMGRRIDAALVALLHVTMATMLGFALLQVVTRYVFDSPFAWTEELSRLLLIVYALIGAATACREDKHPRMDDLLGGLPASVRSATEIVAGAVTVLCLVVLGVHAMRVGARTVSTASVFDLPMSWLYDVMAASCLLIGGYLVGVIAGKRGLAHAALCLALGIALYFFMAFGPEVKLEGAWGSVVLVVALLVFLCIGVAVAFSLLGAAIVGLWLDPLANFDILPQRMLGGIDSFLLIAIPFFMFAGELMNRGGVTQRIIGIARALVAHLRGGLGQVNVVSNFFMAGMSGSSSADCAALGKILIPEMRKSGYDAPFAAATTASSSILANLIPPSINLLIYGSLASVSVGALFLAGVIPGAILVLALMSVVYVYARRNKVPVSGAGFSIKALGSALRDGLWALGLPLIIVVGIRSGVFTATEAAAVAVVYAGLVAAVVYRSLPMRELPEMSRNTAEDTAAILLIIAASTPFAWMLTVQQVPQSLAAAMGPLIEYPFLLLLAINLLLLLVGLPLEPAPAMVILVPILLPIIKLAGIDPVHFGVLMVFNLFIGALTPPIGNLAFIAAMVAKVKPTAVFKALNQYYAALLIALTLISFVPALSLWLPKLLRG